MNLRSMIRPWPDIIAHYDGLDMAALQAIGLLARHIHEGPLCDSLYGWTSMHNLCISQTRMVYPPSGPYLIVSPIGPEQVEFRYWDTDITDRQWHRTVRAEDTIARLSRFIEQLHWVGGPSAQLGS